MSIKVSVIVPVYNNERYVVTCLNSLLAQTLQDVEVICINDGSTDQSSAVLHNFADRDSRVVVVDKENEGYGVGINTGLKLARGKYVTILESDDFADLSMLDTLYSYAETFGLDVVRANFYLYWSKKIKNDHFFEIFANYECDRVIDPSKRDNQHCFYAQPALWSALYNLDFIRRNNLKLTETPGAAYQDTAFNFKIWACAKRVMFVHKPFVHYRQDNEASSINNPGKVNNICIEYDEIRRWLKDDRPDLYKNLVPVMTKMMCDAYLWNIRRISDEFRLDFAHRIAKEFSEAEAAGEVDPSLFAPGQLALVKKSVTDPVSFVDFAVRGIDPEHGLKRMGRKFTTMCQVAKQDGVRAARNLLLDKMKSKVGLNESKLVDLMDNEMASRKAPKYLTTAPANPAISVVLPVYNTASVLTETIDSILAQSFESFELICVDDGSTDGSSLILDGYAAKDARIRVIHQDNHGVAAARNRGLQEVDAPYTLILDSDDLFRFDMFELLYKKAERTSSDLVICNSCEYDGDTYESFETPWVLKFDMIPKGDSFTVEDASDTLFEAFMGWPWDRLYSTEFIKKSGLVFPENLYNSEDGVFVYGLLARAGRIAVMPDVLVKHRSTRKGSVSNSRDKHPECFYEAICMIKRGLQDDSALYRKLEKSFLNWALDYTIWNISTLTDRDVKQKLAAKLVSNGYPELEVKLHPWSYFNLYNGRKMQVRYEKLALVAKGVIKA